MRKKGRAHPDRVEAALGYDALKKTLAAVDAAMNASEPGKARELLLSIAEHVSAATEMPVKEYTDCIRSAEDDAMFSRDAWIAHRRTRTVNPEPDFALYDNPKMSWRALFGSRIEKIDDYLARLIREATGDALGAIGQRLVKGLSTDDHGYPVTRLDLGALEDAAKQVKQRYVSIVLPPAARPPADALAEHGCYDFPDATPTIPRALLKAALASLRQTGKDSHAWVDVSVTWSKVSDPRIELPRAANDEDGGAPRVRHSSVWRENDDGWFEPGNGYGPRVQAIPCQELWVDFPAKAAPPEPTSEDDDEAPDSDHRAPVTDPNVPTGAWVPIHGPALRHPALMRANLVLSWSVLREGGRKGHFRLYDIGAQAEGVDVIHTIPFTKTKTTKATEAA